MHYGVCETWTLTCCRDLAKVTNWFRNLRQTSRKRKQKWSDDDEAESARDTTPSPSSSSQHDAHETDGEDVHMYEYEDARTDDEDDEEVVTPPPDHSSLPPRAVLAITAPRWPIGPTPTAKPLAFGDENEHGVRVEDALLLLSFHNTIVA
jgi:hypothetical protein